MLPKNIRDLKQEAKKNAKAFRRALKLIDGYLESNNPDAICVASAFYKAVEHHMNDGDFKHENLTLYTMIKGGG